MPQPQVSRVHWNDMPEFHEVYMPWCDRVIKSESVRKIVGKVKADQEAIANCGAVLLPKLDVLSTTVILERGGDPHEYKVQYEGPETFFGENLVIEFGGGHHAFMLFPSRVEGYKIGMHIAQDDSGKRSFSPRPLIEKSHLRADVEWTIGQVANVLTAEPSSAT